MLGNGQILYNSKNNIQSFEFVIQFYQFCGNQEDCPLISESGIYGYSGGAVELNNWGIVINQVPGSTYDNFYLNGQGVNYIPSGCGTLTNLNFEGLVHDYININWTGESGVDLNFSYYEIDDLSADLPADFSIKQNFPNPFNPTTLIEFDLYENDHIQIVVYDIRGELITTLVDKYFLTGKHFIEWNGQNNKAMDVPSGIYIYQISNSKIVLSKKMTLLR